MNNWFLHIFFIFIFSYQKPTHGKLFFPPGSDVGYIVPDDASPESYDFDNKRLSNRINSNEIKREKRAAFWNTVFDNLAGGLDGWDTKDASQIHSVTNDQTNEDVPRETLGNTDRSTLRKNEHPPRDGLPAMLYDNQHGVAMGISHHSCDDGKTNLEADWDGSPVSYTCYTPKSRLLVRDDLQTIETCDNVDPKYIPQHYCMNDQIVYNTSLPTYGSHRPLWPVFGEYRYVPPQRWLHSVEHGAVIMLYHPCTEPVLVKQLKKIIRACIYKHVITASTAVSVERPMVLISWGCKLELSDIDEASVVAFIRARALHGPEGKLSKQGQYTEELLVNATIPKGSNINDEHLCPNA